MNKEKHAIGTNLQVSQLDGGRRFGHNVGCLAESSASFLLPFGGDDLLFFFHQLGFTKGTLKTYLSAGFPRGLGLGCHGSLQLHRQSNVFTKEGRRRDIQLSVLSLAEIYELGMPKMLAVNWAY